MDVLHGYRDGRVPGGSRDRVRVRVVVRQSSQRRMAQVVRDELLGLILLSGKQAGSLERLVTLPLSKLFRLTREKHIEQQMPLQCSFISIGSRLHICRNSLFTITPFNRPISARSQGVRSLLASETIAQPGTNERGYAGPHFCWS